MTSIGDYVLYDTPWLASRRAEDQLVIENGFLIDGTVCSGEVAIPDNITGILGGAFAGCTELTAITIPDSVTSIGRSAFNGCENLTEVTIPESVTRIEDYAFSDCENLTKITIYNVRCTLSYDERTISDTATIYAYENSTAHTYANENNRNVVILPRPKRDYQITDSDGTVTANMQTVASDIFFNTFSNDTSYAIWPAVDGLQECKYSKATIYAIAGYQDAITLYSEDSDTKPVTIENDGFTFGAAAIDENDNLYVFGGYSISDDVIEEEQEKNTENLVIVTLLKNRKRKQRWYHQESQILGCDFLTIA